MVECASHHRVSSLPRVVYFHPVRKKKWPSKELRCHICLWGWLLFPFVWVIYCCVTNDQKLSDLKQNPFISSHFCRPATGAWLDWAFCSGCREAAVRVWAAPWFSFGAQGHLPSLFIWWQNLVPCSCWTEVFALRLAIGWQPLSAPRGCPQVLTIEGKLGKVQLVYLNIAYLLHEHYLSST